MSVNEEFKFEEYWSEAWTRHIENYLSAPPRAGYWLSHRFPKSFSILEIAGGSCRDSRYLSQLRMNAIGSDFDRKTLDYVANRYPSSSFKMQKEDAFGLSFADRSIDLSFSNGFWVLFDDNSKIYSLIQEQTRITKKIIVSLVHNADNEKLVALFKEKSKEDTLYDIRFFHREELVQIVKDSGITYKSLKIEKFGGFFDRLLQKKVIGMMNPFTNISTALVPQLYKYQPWFLTERLACIIEL